MKLSSLLNRSVSAALLLSVSALVFAGSTNAEAATSSQGKTRAQVRAELTQAEEAGLVPAGKTDYPPSHNTIARNKINFQKAKAWWEAHGQQSAWRG